MNTHGGKREGAGRKSLTPGEKRVQFSVSVRPETRDKAADLRAAGIKLGLYIDQLVDDLHKEMMSSFDL